MMSLAGQSLALLFFPAVIAYTAVSDLLRMTIPNRVTLLLAGSFPVAALAVAMPPAQIGWHVAVGAGVLVLSFLCFAAGWIGGGDAKAAAATALWLGTEQTLPYLLYGAVLGGGLTLMLLTFRTAPLPALASRQPWLVRLHDPRTGVPYGIALAAAALLVYPDSVWMQALGR